MERGLYAAASGMVAQQAIQEVLAQNIANASTIGYKQDNQTFKAMQGMALRRLDNGMGRGPNIGELGMGCKADQTYTDWQNGSITQTNNPLDASLAANQYFAVSTPQGERYTRAGNFQMDGVGNLLTGAGQPLLDVNNRPVVARGGRPNLDGFGNVSVNGQPIARLKVVQATPNQLTKDGDSLFAAKIPGTLPVAANPQVSPGTLEQSNVNTVRDMVQLITVSRGFDIAQRALVTQDELLRHAASEVGKV